MQLASVAGNFRRYCGEYPELDLRPWKDNFQSSKRRRGRLLSIVLDDEANAAVYHIILGEYIEKFHVSLNYIGFEA